jgi:hypothetical protein
MRDADIADGVGGPGQEDFANGAALLAAGLLRQVRDLAESAAALRAAFAPMPGDPAGGGPLSDVRRQRAAFAAAAEAGARAVLMLEAAEKLGASGDAEAIAQAINAAAKGAGLPAAGLVAPLRAAALSLDTDDGAARIAAAMLAQRLAELLGGGV